MTVYELEIYIPSGTEKEEIRRIRLIDSSENEIQEIKTMYKRSIREILENATNLLKKRNRKIISVTGISRKIDSGEKIQFYLITEYLTTE